MLASLKDNIYLQREQLARILREPLAKLSYQCTHSWNDRARLNSMLLEGYASIPHCTALYCVDTDGIQICDNIDHTGIDHEHFGRDRSQRPYMKETVPNWGYLLSDAYISLKRRRPSLTALQSVRSGYQLLGYLGADFDLRNLHVTAELYRESSEWRQVKGDPVIRERVMYQCRVESPMDRHLEQALSILEELLTDHGVYQCMIHFSSSQVTVWTLDDPCNYRILDDEALSDPDICLVYPPHAYPANAAIPQHDITRILEFLRAMRIADENFYLRIASINLVNGMVSLTFSCDGTHYMSHDEFLSKNIQFWFGAAA